MIVEVILTGLIIYILWQILKKPSDYPPGPWGLPLIGYVPMIRNSDEFLEDLKQRFGSVVCFSVGTKTLVIIYDYKLIKEGFTGLDMVDRPDIKLLSILNKKEKQGIVSTNGEHWHHMRRFSLRHLRDLGMGKSKFVGAVQNEAIQLVNVLKEQAGKPAPIPHALNICVLNVVWQLIASKRYSLDDQEILGFNRMIDDFQKCFSTIVIPDFFPWIRYVIPKYFLQKMIGEDVFDKLSTRLMSFLKVSIDDHIETLQEHDPRDFIDAYLIEMEKKKDNPSSKMSIDDLMSCIGDFFGAGTETTSRTIQWCMFYLANNPQVQSRLQKEIDEVLPKDSQATFEDKPKLPYTDAFIHEVLRHSSLTKFSGFHLATVDTQLGDYRIPKGAYILAVQSCSHYNDEHFESAKEFKPERFMGSDGKFVNPKEGFFPFGIGRRQCLGEALARMELFIFLTTLVQNLHFEVPPEKKIDLNPLDCLFMNLPNDKQNILVTLRS